jgi:hypothetical protein
MKKFWLSLGLTFILTCWCGGGYYGFGTCAAFGQSYYSAPYADPLSQLLYYIAPPVQDQYYQPPQRYQHHETRRERKKRERYERQQAKRAHHDRDKHPPGWAEGKKAGWGEAPMPPGQMKKHDR